MKKCVIISNYTNNSYRKSLLKEKILLFNSANIDVILASSDPMEKYDDVKNYITVNHVCESQYLTEGLFPYFSIGNTSFYRNLNKRKVSYTNYFVKLYQTTLNYCKHLGYDFCYFIDLDVLINKQHLDFIFNKIDYTKVYFYTLGLEKSYQVTFFYGNLDVLTSFFTTDKLNFIEFYAKKERLESNETLVYLLSHSHKDVVELNNEEASVFEHRNLFSINNQAEIYYDSSKNEYIFLAAKGDYCKNTFGVELYEGSSLIFSSMYSHYCECYILNLKSDVNYTIKRYDAEISANTLSSVTEVFTDSTKCATPNNWIQNSN